MIAPESCIAYWSKKDLVPNTHLNPYTAYPMKCKIKIIGSNNDILSLGNDYRGELIANKLIVNSRIEHHLSSENIWELQDQDYSKELTLDIKDVIICDQYIHVDTWLVDADSNGGRVEMELYWESLG